MKHRLMLLLSLLTLGAAHAQVGKVFTTDNELSSSLINEILQDRSGMIWIATENGLDRYNGSKFTIYKRDSNDPHSLCHNLVRDLFEDSRGHLLVGTYAGLQLYDPATDKFSLPAVDASGEPFNGNITHIAERRNGEVLVLSQALYSLTIDGDRLVLNPVAMPDGVNMGHATYLFEDERFDLWIGCRHAICRLTREGELKVYKEEGKELIVSKIVQDNRGNVYVGTMDEGLLRYDRRSDAFVNILFEGRTNLPVKELYAANAEEIYIGTDGQGMKIYNANTGKIADYGLINKQLPPPVGSAKIHSVLKDGVGNYWVALYQRGVVVIPATPNNFKYIGSRSIDRDLIGSNCINAICRDHAGTIWIGTDNDGIYGIVNERGELRRKARFASSERPNSVPSTVMKLYEDSHHTLWVGSFNRGLGRVDTATGTCDYLDALCDRNGNPVKLVYDLVEDNDQRLWIATMGMGLYWYDLRTGRIHSREQHDGEYINNWQNCLLHASDDKIYVGTYDGAFCIDLAAPELPSTLVTGHGYIIFSMYEDRDGILWMGSAKGLLAWNPRTEELQLHTPDNLSYDAIYAIRGDEWNNLWISTNNGILQFNPESGRFVHFYVGDGLQGNEFTKNASYGDRNGELWFGGTNGVTYFEPQEIINPARKWAIRITDFYLHNRRVRKGMFSGGREIVDAPVFEAGEFRLSHADNSFSIEFSTVGFCNSEYITYLYAMDDDPWITLPAGSKRVSFSNLASGSHRFRVQAMDRTVQSDIREIAVVIRPAWWETWWARLIYLLLLCGIAWLVVLYFRHRNETRRKMLEHIHAKEIDEAKLQFFINISHEIRTPLSLIISPLLKLMENDGDPQRQRIYRTVHRNAERILQLINQLMDMRKIEKGQIMLGFREIDLVRFLEEICMTMEPLGADKRITLSFDHEGLPQLPLWVSPDYFDKILINLLSNAFKFTPEGGSIRVSLAEVPTAQGQQVELVVADTGVGIRPEEMEHIFERFYQAKENHTKLGTGIGLHLTRMIVDLHHGSIRAENNPDGPGCRFIVRLPLGNAHLDPEMLDTEPVDERNLLLPQPQPLSAAAAEPSGEEPRIYARTKYRILVVEDDHEIRNYLRQELSSEFHVAESMNGREALKQIFKVQPDLVISDVMMPEMDGMTLCRKIKQNINLNSIPVILLTARAREADNVEGLGAGADAYITKPFSVDILRGTVKNLIQNREQLRNTFGTRQIHEEKLRKIEVLSPDERLMTRIMRVINDNIDNPRLSVEMIAAEVGISRVHLHRKLKELTNQTTRDFIRNVRLKQAATLLREKRCTVNEIARLTGFSSPNNFATAFKNLYGVPPTAYMNNADAPADSDDSEASEAAADPET